MRWKCAYTYIEAHVPPRQQRLERKQTTHREAYINFLVVLLFVQLGRHKLRSAQYSLLGISFAGGRQSKIANTECTRRWVHKDVLRFQISMNDAATHGRKHHVRTGTSKAGLIPKLELGKREQKTQTTAPRTTAPISRGSTYGGFWSCMYTNASNSCRHHFLMTFSLIMEFL